MHAVNLYYVLYQQSRKVYLYDIISCTLFIIVLEISNSDQ